MKKKLLVYSMVLLLLLFLSACTFFPREIRSLDNDEAAQTENTITVQGTASITAAPTIAYVNIGVTTFNKDAVIAQTDNAAKMTLVYKALDSLGISKDKIKTVTYNISARYNYKDNISVLAGYDVTNGIQVTVVDLAKVSEVLDMTVKEGINQSNSITFSISDEESSKYYQQALAAAFTNAKAEADTLAAAAGITLNKPSQITVASSGSAAPVSYDTSWGVKSDEAATPISGGELKVEASVTVVYGY